MRRTVLVGRVVFLFLLMGTVTVYAWEDHSKCTRLALESVAGLGEVRYESIDAVLPDLHAPGGMLIGSRSELADALKIHEEKIDWEWRPKKLTALEVLAGAVQNPDGGMDQNWVLASYQETMGGTTGFASQSIRHMVYPAFRWSAPLRTFHIPFHEMGQAHERAELFFDLALQARRKGHDFWAFRFLGWGLHYVQDLTQPYHDSQFASFRLLALGMLFTSQGWKGFVAETTRYVGNFHFAFELYVDDLIDLAGSTDLSQALRVSRGTPRLKLALENDSGANNGANALPLRRALDMMIDTGNGLAPGLASAEADWIGDLLLAPQMDLVAGPRDGSGRGKLDFLALARDPKRAVGAKELAERAYEALSNMGIASRWYVERFLRQSSAVVPAE